MGGYPPEYINDFSRQASSANIVVIGEPIYSVAGHPELMDMYDGHVFYYIKVSNVLAASSDYIDKNGQVSVSEYILVSDHGGTGFDSYFGCPSLFFLSAIFSNDERWLNSSRNLVASVITKFEGGQNQVFELVSGSKVFPIINFDQYSAQSPDLAPDLKEVWASRKDDLKDYWGLSDFTQVEEFATRALLPFFEQVDEDWFAQAVEGFSKDSPLRKVSDTLKQRRTLERETSPSHSTFRRAIRIPFVGGEALNQSNLSSTFPSFDD
ncbi:MAG: hypothetical protein ACSHX8_13835 [Opitutaceae bacterium]